MRKCKLEVPLDSAECLLLVLGTNLINKDFAFLEDCEHGTEVGVESNERNEENSFSLLFKVLSGLELRFLLRDSLGIEYSRVLLYSNILCCYNFFFVRKRC